MTTTLDLTPLIEDLPKDLDKVRLNDLQGMVELMKENSHPRLQEFQTWEKNLKKALEQLEVVWCGFFGQIHFTCLNDFTQAYDRMTNRMLELSRNPDDLSEANLLRGYLDKVLEELSAPEEADTDLPKFAGRSLRAPQAAAYRGFCRWIDSESEEPKMGHAILPGGAGKTALSVLMAEKVRATGKKTLVLTLNNQDASHFAEEYRKHAVHIKNGQRANTLVAGGRPDPTANFVIGNFAGQRKWPAFKELGLIVIDEADVHALSDTNAALLKQIAAVHKIPIVAVSATAELGNGKIIEDVFPDAILFMALPESLPALLKMGLMPEADFFDVELHARINVGKKGSKEISEEAQETLINQGWIDKLLDFFEKEVIQNKVIPKTVFRFQNNKLLEELITKAAKRGIRLARLTGDEDAEACRIIRQQLQDGTLHGVAGSRKVGRGMDIPEVEVVIGSELTKSPQIFWQGRARGFRLDPKNPLKHARLYNCVPSEVYAGEEKLDRGEGPLTHASFFEEDYFERNPDTGRSIEARFATTYSLKEIARIRSNREVLASQEEYTKKPPNFISFVEAKAQTIAAIGRVREVTAGEVMRVVRSKKKRVRTLAPSSLAWDDRLTYEEETKCLETVQADGPEKTAALEKLVRSHKPILKAIAQVFSDNRETQEELVQEGIVALISSIPRYNGTTRFIRFAIQGIVGEMIQYKWRDGRPFAHLEALEKRLKRLKNEGANWTRTDREKKLRFQSHEIDKDYLMSLLEQISVGTEVDSTSPDELEGNEEPADVQEVTRTKLRYLEQGFNNVLSERQKYILTRRYGLEDDVERTFTEVGEEMDFSKSRIRTIEREALIRLRDQSSLTNFKDIHAQLSIVTQEERRLYIEKTKAELNAKAPELYSRLEASSWEDEASEREIDLIEKRIKERDLVLNGIAQDLTAEQRRKRQKALNMDTEVQSLRSILNLMSIFMRFEHLSI